MCARMCFHLIELSPFFQQLSFVPLSNAELRLGHFSSGSTSRALLQSKLR